MKFLTSLRRFLFGAPPEAERAAAAPEPPPEPPYAERYFLSSDGLNLHYRDYEGPPGRTPVLCIPGLTRNARDFEFIAKHLSATRRVLVTDLRGRGKSAPAKDHRHYQVPVEAADMMRLLEHAGLKRVIVLGTSRGGIVAMAMAATRPGTLLGAILNDIGGEIEAKGLSRILEFIGREPRLPDWESAVAGLKRAYQASFPDVEDVQWARMARALYREEDGWILPDYDPRLGDAMREGGMVMPMGPNVPLWPVFAALTKVPTLVLRGANSDLLSAETVAKMATLKPDLIRVTVPNRGHVPFLDETEAVAAIDAFLTRYG